MKMVWLRPEHNKDPKKKQDFTDAIKNSRVLIDRLLEILDSMEDELDSQESHTDFYDAGYPFKQAFVNGQKKTIEKVKGLFDFEKGNKTS